MQMKLKVGSVSGYTRWNNIGMLILFDREFLIDNLVHDTKQLKGKIKLLPP